MKKKAFFIAVLASCFLLTASAEAKEKIHGVDLIVQTSNGEIVTGELMAVGERRIFLLELPTANDLSFSIDDITAIRILKPSKVLRSAWKGFLFVGAPLAVVAALLHASPTAYLIDGVVPAAVGGLLGLSKGVDEIVRVNGLPPEKKEIVLKKLSSMALFPGKLPDIYDAVKKDRQAKWRQSKAAAESVDKVRERSKNLILASPFSRWHLSFSLDDSVSGGYDHYIKAFKDIGFGDTRPEEDWWFFGLELHFPSKSFPVVHRDLAVAFRNVQLEYSLSRKLALGLNFSTLGRDETRGYKNILLLRAGQQYYSELYLKASYKGTLYFLTAALMPLPDTFFSRVSFKLGAGVGMSGIRVNYRTSDDELSEGEYSDHVTVSKNRPALMGFLELSYFINRMWSLGLTARYQFVPITVPTSEMKGYYWDFDEAAQQLIHSVMNVSVPEQRLNLGGLSIGLTFCLHF